MHHDNNHLDPVYLVIDSLKLKRRAHQKFIRCGEGRGGVCVRSDHTLIAFYFPPSNQGNFKSFFGRPLVLTFHSAVIDGRWAVAVIVQVI